MLGAYKQAGIPCCEFFLEGWTQGGGQEIKMCFFLDSIYSILLFAQDTLLDLDFASKYVTKPMKARLTKSLEC